MDSSVEKQGSGVVLDPDEDERPPASGETKACTECHTTKTPLWRGGPFGPMSLCNACGIRYQKKRREAMGVDGGGKQQQQQHQHQHQQRRKKATAASKRVREREAGEATVALRAAGFGKDAVLKQRRRMRRKRRSEEERAAILLLALSSGVVSA